LTADVVYDKHRDYCINGLVIAMVARLVSAGKGVQPGDHFMTDAVDLIALMAEPRTDGVELNDSLEPIG
jgi:hypothetical protein